MTFDIQQGTNLWSFISILMTLLGNNFFWGTYRKFLLALEVWKVGKRNWIGERILWKWIANGSSCQEPSIRRVTNY